MRWSRWWRHDYSQPCWGQEGCFWTTFFIPLHLKTLAPDVVVPYTFADYRALRDPVMEYVLEGVTNAPSTRSGTFSGLSLRSAAGKSRSGRF